MSQVSPQSPNAPEEVPNYTILKAIVIFLGILLVGGFALVIGTIIYRVSNADEQAQTGVTQTLVEGSGREISVSVPPGAKLIETQLSERYLTIRHLLPDGTYQMTVIDAKAGIVLSTVTFQEEKAIP